MSDLPNKALFTPAELADHLNLSVFTIRRWIKEGKLTADRYSRKTTRITRESILMLKNTNIDEQ